MFKFRFFIILLSLALSFSLAHADSSAPTSSKGKKSFPSSRKNLKKKLKKDSSFQTSSRKLDKGGKGDEGYELIDLSKRKRAWDWDRPYLLAAYAALWLFVFFYLLFLTRRLFQTERQIEDFQRLLDEKLSQQGEGD